MAFRRELLTRGELEGFLKEARTDAPEPLRQFNRAHEHATQHVLKRLRVPPERAKLLTELNQNESKLVHALASFESKPAGRELARLADEGREALLDYQRLFFQALERAKPRTRWAGAREKLADWRAHATLQVPPSVRRNAARKALLYALKTMTYLDRPGWRAEHRQIKLDVEKALDRHQELRRYALGPHHARFQKARRAFERHLNELLHAKHAEWEAPPGREGT